MFLSETGPGLEMHLLIDWREQLTQLRCLQVSQRSRVSFQSNNTAIPALLMDGMEV